MIVAAGQDGREVRNKRCRENLLSVQSVVADVTSFLEQMMMEMKFVNVAAKRKKISNNAPIAENTTLILSRITILGLSVNKTRGRRSE